MFIIVEILRDFMVTILCVCAKKHPTISKGVGVSITMSTVRTYYLPTYREAFVHDPMLSLLCALTSKTDSVCGTSPDSLSKTILVVELSTVISSKCSLLSGLNRMWYLLTSDQELWVPVPTFGGGSQVKVTDGTFMSTSMFRF